MAEPKNPKSKKRTPTRRKSSVDTPRVIVVDATRGNLVAAVGVVTDTLIEVLSAMATQQAEVRATIDDVDMTDAFDKLEADARQHGERAVQVFAGLPVGVAVLAAGAALHSVVEAYKKAYAEAAAAVRPMDEKLREGGCGHTEAEHAEMAAAMVSAASPLDGTTTATVPIPAGRMRGRNAAH